MTVTTDLRAMRRRVTRSLLVVSAVVLTIGLASSPSLATAAPTPDGALVDQIRSLEYQFSSQGPGVWTAPNRARGIRSVVDRDGLQWSPRTAATGDWAMRLSLSSIGRGSKLSPIDLRDPRRSAANRVERAFDGGVEWFVNDIRGLEHGVTLERRPAAGLDGELAIEISLHGELQARIDQGGRDVGFVDAAERVQLRYDGLLVVDAAGDRLPARFEISPGGLRLLVDDRGASYPIVIDPLSGAPDWSVAGGQLGSAFGVSVAGAGDLNNDNYDDVIVGAQLFDNGEASEGKVFVFMGGPSGLSIVPQWTAEGDAVGVRFGGAVAGAGDLNNDGFDDVVVGARRYTDTIVSEGAAFVFFGSASGLDAGGTRPSGTPANADWWARGQQFEASFGKSVAAAGDINNDGFADLLISADEYTAGATNEGAVFIYRGSATGPNLGGARPVGSPANADWQVQSGAPQSDFGVSADGAGDVNNDGFDDVIVGAWVFDNNNLDEGRAYVYLGSGAGLNATPSWFFDGLQDTAHVGVSVAGAGDVNGDGFDDVIIGADEYTNGQVDEGSAFLFLGRPNGQLASTPDWRGESEQADSLYGFSVSGAGDINGDGFDDVVVGAASFDITSFDDGKVYVYLGSPNGLMGRPAHEIELAQADTVFGVAVAGAGDVNNDGYDDLLAGASLYDDLLADEGGAFVWHGCPDPDRDGVCDPLDNCPERANPQQEDEDLDGLGDACDPCADTDEDGVCDVAQVFVEGAGAGEQVLFGYGYPIRYIGNSSDPGYGLNWTSELFPNDALWNSGQYGAGYETSAGGANDLILSEHVASTSRSVYTRAQVLIDDITEIESLFLEADYDDGYAVWINGVEVYRSAEMPGGLLEWDTDAISLHESSNGAVPEYDPAVEISVVGIPALHNGLNTISVAAWNFAGSSSDLVIVPRLTYNRLTTTSMRFFPNFLDPLLGTTWVLPGFDDSGWAEGNYGVGYDVDFSGSNAQDLVNSPVSPMSSSVYTRSVFNVVKSTVESVWIGADYDDGYIAWLNGVEIYRSPEMPAGAPNWDTSPTSHESSNGAVPDYGVLTDVSMPGLIALQDGANVLAVGVWNNGAPMTDALVVVPRLSVNEEQVDNCPASPNPSQLDSDGDGDGDACDLDDDNDGVLDDGDSSGNSNDNRCTGGATSGCDDNCPLIANPLQEDADGDGLGDVCDACPADGQNDADVDAVCGDVDNCPTMFNPGQENNEGDALGDACDPDDDNDGILDDGDSSGTIGDARCTGGANAGCDDNCQFVPNASQTDSDGDGFGFACDCDPADGQVWETPGLIDLRLSRDDCVVRTCSETEEACVDDADCLGGTNVCRGTCRLSAGVCASNVECAEAGELTLNWLPPTDSGATSLRYDTLQTLDPTDFVSAAVCVESDGVDTISIDATVPSAGSACYYVVRVENDCPSANSSMGSDSFGVPRVGRVCP